MKNKLKKKGLYFFIGVLSIIYFLYFQNNSIVTSQYTIHSALLPKSFNGYKIIQLSDLHNKSFGKDQGRLLEKIKQVEPDLIVFTGDLIDSRRYDEEPSLLLMEELMRIAPIYYVTGNHEWASGEYSGLENKLKDIGVHVMRNTTKEIAIGTDKIQLSGIDDPVNTLELTEERATTERNLLKSLEGIEKEETFQILLSHRPEMISLYSEYGFDLVFSGHAHGGQIRIPFIGGLIAPHQGLLPAYTSGKHTSGDTKVIVNRGLGNSLFPFRIFNRPEIVEVTLSVD